MSRARRILIPAIASLVALSCDENLPSGPATFTGAAVRIMTTRDTIVVGDSNVAQARTTDLQGRIVQGLTYTWATADSNVAAFAAISPADTDAVEGRKRTLLGKRPGLSLVATSLPDPRFVTTGDSKMQTVVVGGVRVLTSRDTTLTSINDTAVAIAAGLVRVNGALVTRASQGIKWVHRGDRTQVIGTGDTIRYVAKLNGVDTLIATHDFCLAGQKCADTVLARVTQQLTLTLSQRAFAAWSFSDSVGPTITLADRRGNGQAGTAIRFVPRTSVDSNIVRVVGPFGVGNPATGTMPVPKLVTAGNGTARVAVLGVASNLTTVLATDSVSVVVRQVARRVAAEPLRALLTVVDSIPARGVARDARGAVIADATIDITAIGVPFNGIWAGPAASGTVQGTLVPTLSGPALPANNPGAPQIPASLDAAVLTLVPVDTAKALLRQQTISVLLLDSLSQPAVGRWVRFFASSGLAPDSVQAGSDGFATVVWTPPSLAGRYTLTGVRGTSTAMNTLADSAGRIVIRQSVEVIADSANATQSTVVMSATTIAPAGTATVTITAKDEFGNVVKDVLPAVFTLGGAGGGTFSPLVCAQGVCTSTYTAPAAGPATVTVQIGATHILNSPINLTIP